VRGTPTFFLGTTDADGKTISHLQLFDGAVDYATLKHAIERLLAPEK